MAETAKRDVLPDLLKALLILSTTALMMGQCLGEGNWTNRLSASPLNMPLSMSICGYYFIYSRKGAPRHARAAVRFFVHACRVPDDNPYKNDFRLPLSPFSSHPLSRVFKGRRRG